MVAFPALRWSVGSSFALNHTGSSAAIPVYVNKRIISLIIAQISGNPIATVLQTFCKFGYCSLLIQLLITFRYSHDCIAYRHRDMVEQVLMGIDHVDLGLASCAFPR